MSGVFLFSSLGGDACGWLAGQKVYVDLNWFWVTSIVAWPARAK